MTPPAAARILMVEIAGLGDNVHLLPALWLTRQTYPQAQLHLLCASGPASLFRLAPWIDRVVTYPWNPRPSFLEHLRISLGLRREHYDLLVNFSGSDRTSVLSALSGARERWGRRPHDGGMTGFSACYTRVLEHPFYREPMYRQKFELLRAQGFTGGEQPEFHVTIDAAGRRAAGIASDDDRRYLHVSPYASAAHKELPPAQMAALLDALAAQYPRHRLALSCSGAPRERAAMDALLPRLRQAPWQVFAGSLDIPQLASVIQGAALHLCPDTGSLHLARLVGTPSVVWYRRHGGETEWVEESPSWKVFYSDEGDATHMAGIDTAALLGGARALLAP